MYVCGWRSVAPQIEIDGQDYRDNDDGSEDEDQNTILDDPAEKRQRNVAQVCLLKQSEKKERKSHKTATTLCAEDQEPSELYQAFLFTPGLRPLGCKQATAA